MSTPLRVSGFDVSLAGSGVFFSEIGLTKTLAVILPWYSISPAAISIRQPIQSRLGLLPALAARVAMSRA